MGVEFKGVNHIVNYGSPTNTEAYMQAFVWKNRVRYVSGIFNYFIPQQTTTRHIWWNAPVCIQDKTVHESENSASVWWREHKASWTKTCMLWLLCIIVWLSRHLWWMCKPTRETCRGLFCHSVTDKQRIILWKCLQRIAHVPCDMTQ